MPKMPTVMSLLIAASLFNGFALADDKDDKPADLTGIWDVTRGKPEEKMAGFTLTLKQDGDKLTGFIAWPDGKVTPIADGVIKDGQMSFTARPASATHFYGGKVDGDAIKGTWGVGLLTLDFAARRRVADKPNLTGTWDVTRGKPEEKLSGFTLTLKQEGDKLTGSIAWPDGKVTPIADVHFKDGAISFKVRPGSATQDYGGKVDGDTIKGKWAVTIAVFDWQAKRRGADPVE